MEGQDYEIQVFVTDDGVCPYTDWLQSLDSRIRTRVISRVDRMEVGNFGDCESVGEGVFELRMHFGSGYRVYLGKRDQSIVLILCGGDKSSQKQDIKNAQKWWAGEYKR